MQLEKGDPRHALSRRMQDFHESDPATQAAINGEEYFDVTPGHLLSSALESGYFETVEECLDFFGLEREVLKRREPFNSWEITALENKIHTEADERLRSGEEARYEHWAEWVIATGTIPTDATTSAVEELMSLAVFAEPNDDIEMYADHLEEARYSSRGVEYHVDIFRMQVARLTALLSRDCFATTLANAAESFVQSGLLETQDEDDRRWEIDTLKRKLAVAAYCSQRREVEDGLWDLSPFEENDWENRFEDIDEEDFLVWASDGHAIVLSAKDLRLFASNYAAPDHIQEWGEEDMLLTQDAKYQKLMSMIKNTPQRIQDIKAHIAFLRK